MTSLSFPSTEVLARREREAAEREQARAALQAAHRTQIEARSAERQAEALRLVEVKAARREQLVLEAEQAEIQRKLDARADRAEARRVEAKAQAAKKRARNRKPRAVGAPREPRAAREPVGHGSVALYNKGCRCDPCKAGKAAYRKASYVIKPPRPTPEHGTPARYTSKKDPCRCDLCREAMTTYSRDYRNKKAAANE